MTEITLVPTGDGKSRAHADFCALQEASLQGDYARGRQSPTFWNQILASVLPGSAGFWVAYQGDRPVGRIGAGLLSRHAAWGSLGFFEVVTQELSERDARTVAKKLLDVGTDWLKEQGRKHVIGPMNLNTWFSYRFRLDADPQLFPWEPVHPPEYVKMWTDYGFTINSEYIAYHTDHLQGFVQATEKDFNHASTLGYRLQPFQPSLSMSHEISSLHQMSREAFRQNHFYEDLSLDHFQSLYVPNADAKGTTEVLIILAPDGQPVGFGYALMCQGDLVIKTMAVSEAHRGKGLSNALAHALGRFGLQNGSRGYTTAIIHRGAQSESYAKKGKILWEHHYGLFELCLGSEGV